MCAPTDKILVSAEWLIGGPAHCEFIGRTLIQEIAKLSPWKQRKYRHWWTTADGFIELDACLADEVLWLNGQGVTTFSCCCEHGGQRAPWIALYRRGTIYDPSLGPDRDGRAQMLRLSYQEHHLAPPRLGWTPDRFIFDARRR